MESKPCGACGREFHPRRQSPNQSYCPEAACQRERRHRWRQDKRQTDPDYRDNQARAQHGWAQRHPDYWREYRGTHPQYEQRNREQQRQRDRRRGTRDLAKSDASKPTSPVASGTYRLLPVAMGDLAKSDACLVEITLLSAA
jgi:hypothetical protein